MGLLQRSRRLEAQHRGGGKKEAFPRGSSFLVLLTMDVVFQLLNNELLVIDDSPDHVTNRDNADHVLVL